MNKNQLMKFSLTLVCSAVLAACSSGGSNDNSAAEKAKIAEQQKLAAEKEAAAKAAAEKAAAEKAAAEKAAAEKQAELAKAVSVGHKFVKKTDSNFNLSIEAEKAGTKSSRSTGASTNMDIELYPSLDTVVVSVPLKRDASGELVVDEKAPIGYVEDFDFRGNVDNTTGKHTLAHIYKTANGATTGSSTARTETETKTATAGVDSGEALVYEAGRTVYIPTDEKVTVKNGTQVDNVQANFRDRKDTVAEVYGHRTFVAGDSLAGVDSNGNPKGGSETALDNAPFLGKNTAGEYLVAGKLNHVQYGRVTSRLDNVDREATKEGLNAGKFGTKVVSYGGYGEKGTENSYFYRGVGDTKYNADLAGSLADHYATYNAAGDKVAAGKLTYQGHAVTYGFAHEYDITKPESDRPSVPNALGQKLEAVVVPALVSGTHVTANIDLASKAVTGNLYDVWSLDNKNVSKDIATFKGTLENDGTIKGDSTRVAGGEGTFNANLFGDKAQELGGALASKATDAASSWGAVFGAKVQNVPGTPPAKPAPAPIVEEPKPSAWGVKTDE